jgi:hypothetical protein
MYVENASDPPKMLAAAANANARLPWPPAVLFCVYLFFIGTGFIKVVPLFITLFRQANCLTHQNTKAGRERVSILGGGRPAWHGCAGIVPADA